MLNIIKMPSKQFSEYVSKHTRAEISILGGQVKCISLVFLKNIIFGQDLELFRPTLFSKYIFTL